MGNCLLFNYNLWVSQQIGSRALFGAVVIKLALWHESVILSALERAVNLTCINGHSKINRKKLDLQRLTGEEKYCWVRSNDPLMQ